MKTPLRSLVLLPVVMLLVSGCRISHTEDGKNGDDVRVATPFGNMQVKTDPNKVAEGLGLPVYPGAVVEVKRNKNGKDENTSADFHMGFGSFQIRVKAVGYVTSDSADKVEAFYRKALAEYGDVITCHDNKPLGAPTRTGQGLTCDDKDGHVNVNDKGPDMIKGDVNLKAGSKQHQHIASIETKDGKTRFGLVALDLPGDMDKKGKEREAN